MRSGTLPLAIAGVVMYTAQQLSEHVLQRPRFAQAVTAAYVRQARVALTALTASGPVPLSKVALAPVLHSGGPLVFGVFASTPLLVTNE